VINHWSDQPADDQLVSSRSYPATTGQPDADYSSRLFRTRYRPGQLDTWFWVVLLRALRFPPPFLKRDKKKRKDYKKKQKA